jgi:hypothetical protein
MKERIPLLLDRCASRAVPHLRARALCKRRVTPPARFGPTWRFRRPMVQTLAVIVAAASGIIALFHNSRRQAG